MHVCACVHMHVSVHTHILDMSHAHSHLHVLRNPGGPGSSWVQPWGSCRFSEYGLRDPGGFYGCNPVGLGIWGETMGRCGFSGFHPGGLGFFRVPPEGWGFLGAVWQPLSKLAQWFPLGLSEGVMSECGGLGTRGDSWGAQ